MRKQKLSISLGCKEPCDSDKVIKRQNLVMQIQKQGENNFIFNQRKRSIAALTKTKIPNRNSFMKKSVCLNKSTQLSQNHENAHNFDQNFVKNKSTHMQKYQRQPTVDSSKYTHKAYKRSYSMHENQKTRQILIYKGANVINMVSNIPSESSKSKLKCKSNYCKKITLSNLDRYFKYCVDRIPNVQLVDLKPHNNEPIYSRIHGEKQNNQMNQDQNFDYQNNKSVNLNGTNNYQPAKSNLLKDSMHQRRYSISQHSRARPLAQSHDQGFHRKRRIRKNYSPQKRKQDCMISPWDSPENNYEEFMAEIDNSANN